MNDKIMHLREALLQTVANTRNRYALILLAVAVDRSVLVASDFVSSSEILFKLQGLSATGTGLIEPSYDAIYFTMVGDIPLDWDSGNRKLVVFAGDETGQTEHGISDLETADALWKNSAIFYGFVTPELAGAYQELADQSGGSLFDIAVKTTDLESVLSWVIKSNCP